MVRIRLVAAAGLLMTAAVVPVEAQQVTSLTLIDADTDQPIAAFDPLPGGATIDLAALPTRNLNVRANTSPATVGSVRFDLDGSTGYRTESTAPYALGGDSGGDYAAWTPGAGSHTVTATAYSGSGGTGTAGTPLTVAFTVVDGGVTPPPTPTPVPTPIPGGTGAVSGELKVWHTVTVTFQGPATSEIASPNPFRDYRLDVTFSQEASGETVRVPGFYAADGNASETSASGGDRWRVRFVPDETGTWSYAASFRQGTDVAASTDPGAGSATAFDGASGSFTVGASDKAAPDLRAKGLLRYTGERYLVFAGTGERFVKGGADSPENFLAFSDFDGTRDAGGSASMHSYGPHLADWRSGDPTWQGGKGKAIIGALDYLASRGVNSVYFLTYNIDGGDGQDVWPWSDEAVRDRYDVSKLAQWEIVFAHMERLGMQLHVVTQETENDQALDGGALGTIRKIYYRELVARFAHHLAVEWNLGEENTNTDAERRAFASFIHALDPWDHPVVVHTNPSDKELVYAPLLGFADLEGPSIQNGVLGQTHEVTTEWLDRSEAAGKPWFVCLDENGPAGDGVLPDADDPGHDAIRRGELWGNLMAGGAGVEWYFGYSYPNNDLTCEDFRSRDAMWEETGIALGFFRDHLPFWQMRHHDELTSRGDDYCLADPGRTYAVYEPGSGSDALDLGSSTGTFTVTWFNPRSGGAPVGGSVGSVHGPGQVDLGQPPVPDGQDWVALVTLDGAPANRPPHVVLTSPAGGTSFAAPAEIQLSANAWDDDGAVTRVDFLVNGYAVGSVITPPYELAWTPCPSGEHIIVASAVDDRGGTTSSAPVTISIGPGPRSMGELFALIDHLFGDGQVPAGSDYNGDGTVSAADIFFLMGMLLGG